MEDCESGEVLMISRAEELHSYAGGKMPAQRPGQSETRVGTPWAFIDACEDRWGDLALDLAADEDNAKAPRFLGEGVNSLAQPWHKGGCDPLWLNPPFDHIEPWARKCAKESALGARILLLVPASVGAAWYWNWVANYAEVNVLTPRLAFQGHHKLRTCGEDCDGCQGYPKDLIVAAYGFEGVGGSMRTGFRRWFWRAAA